MAKAFALNSDNVQIGLGSVATTAAVAALDDTDTEAAIAVAEGLGADPTQESVDDIRAAFDIYQAAIDAAKTAVAADAAQVMALTYDDSVLNTKAKVQAAYRALGNTLIANSLIDNR